LQCCSEGFFSNATSEEEESSKLGLVLQQLTIGLNSGNPMTVFWTVVVARQSPVLPFSLGNYFIGAGTRAPLLPAVLGTMVGCLPLNVVWMGAGAGGMAAMDMAAEQEIPLAQILETVGVVVTLGLAAALGKTVWQVYASSSDGDETSDEAETTPTSSSCSVGNSRKRGDFASKPVKSTIGPTLTGRDSTL
jgi:hypothetical protein